MITSTRRHAVGLELEAPRSRRRRTAARRCRSDRVDVVTAVDPRHDDVDQLVDAVPGDLGVDRLDDAVRGLRVEAMHRRLVRHPPGPEDRARRARRRPSSRPVSRLRSPSVPTTSSSSASRTPRAGRRRAPRAASSGCSVARLDTDQRGVEVHPRDVAYQVIDVPVAAGRHRRVQARVAAAAWMPSPSRRTAVTSSRVARACVIVDPRFQVEVVPGCRRRHPVKPRLLPDVVVVVRAVDERGRTSSRTPSGSRLRSASRSGAQSSSR